MYNYAHKLAYMCIVKHYDNKLGPNPDARYGCLPNSYHVNLHHHSNKYIFTNRVENVWILADMGRING